MMTPQVTNAYGSYLVTWAYDGVRVGFEADRLRNHKDGRMQARVRVTATVADADPLNLHHGTLNLAAGRSRRELSRDLEGRFPHDGLNWDRLVEESCRTIMEAEDEGSPVEPLEPTANVDVEFLMRPLLLEGLPVVWYAPGGSAKSLLALYAALLVQNGITFFGERTRRANVLYMDWEVTREEAARRCTLLANGLRQTHIGASFDFPLYRRCMGALQDDASDIAKVIAKHDIGLVIVDSAGAACGGDIMSGELAVQMFNTLRKVTAATNATTCILTHTTKADRREENGRRLPIGSVYFENLARMTWELRPQETNRDSSLRLGIFARKCNMGRPEPVGLQFSFSRDAIAVELAGVSDVSTEQGATRDVIKSELSRGQASIAELAEAAAAPPATVRWHLMKLKQAGQVEDVSRGVYRLVGGCENEG
jgi:DNA-binding transcriptional ArsR family regulator